MEKQFDSLAGTVMMRTADFTKQQEEAEERIKLLEATLRFYANTDHYETGFPKGERLVTHIESDGGERARKALNGGVSEEAKRLL